ncbi:TSUP family transporter [Burkholderia cepacia]|uniref:TSUP family transporter n=1 Tax=Burkholderia cepacia TaxID=292 RepID=UPI0005A0C48F|nr:TSUP family transporter [Burkholderia cepacia]
MNSASCIGFLCIVAVGCYLQTFTGFALGIFVLGAVALLQIVKLETTATAINIMTLVNTALTLRGNLHHLNWKLFARTLLGVVPGVPVGVWLLDALSTRNTHLLQLALGLVVLLAGAMLWLRPKVRSIPSAPSSFVIAGGFGGILGGLFSVPGPPIIYQFYVQPLALEQVRLTLLGIFGAVSMMRFTILLADGSVDSNAIWLGLLSIPVVVVTTALFLRYPPKLSELTVRRCAFLLLSTMGLCIFAMAWS